MKDCIGNDVHEGAILKVFHFWGRRKRKNFMYKQVGGLTINQLYRKIHHLPFRLDAYYLKPTECILDDSVVVECTCDYHQTNDLKINRFFGA